MLLEQLKRGVFITVKDTKNRVNTMTIAWGHVGIIWSRPVFIAYVRYSRYTYDLLRNAKDFTINVPKQGTLGEALKIAGSYSGRDIDKFEKAQITKQRARTVNSPVIMECPLNYECKMIYSQTQEPALIPDDIKEKHYKNHDTHIMFYGEIMDVYLREDEK